MAKVTVNKGGAVVETLTPSQQVIADANGIVHVTDQSGRRIGVRKMTMSVRRRAFKAISPESIRNERYLGLAMLAACVVEINGDKVDPLAGGGSELVLDAMIDRLDDDGFLAVGEAMRILNPPRDEDGSELKNL